MSEPTDTPNTEITDTQRDVTKVMDSLNNLFNLSQAEERQRRKAQKVDLHERLCAERLVPRYATYADEHFWDRQNLAVMTASQLDATPDVVADFGFSGDRSPVRPSTLLRRDPSCQHVYGQVSLPCPPGQDPDEFVMLPNNAGRLVSHANTYKPGGIAPAETGGPVPMEFLRHITWMVPDPTEADWLVGFFASCVQHPDRYSPQALLLAGNGRNGKNVTLGLFARVVGQHNVAAVDMATLHGTYNEFLTRQYVAVDEFSMGGANGAEVYGNIKNWTGRPRHQTRINGKYQPVANAWVQPRFLLTTNRSDALKHMSEDDDRLCVVGCYGRPVADAVPPDPDLIGSPAYFKKLAQLFLSDDDFAGRVVRHLMSVDLAVFEHTRALRGQTRSSMMTEALSPEANAAFELVTTGAFFGRELFTHLELEQELETSRTKSWNSAAYAAGLRRAGSVNLGRAQALKGRPSVWTGAYCDLADGTACHSMSTERRGELTEAAAQPQVFTAMLKDEWARLRLKHVSDPLPF